MTPEVKAAWVEALRSGKYKQGRGQLCRGDDGAEVFCCLGVLYDVAAPGPGVWVKEHPLELTWRALAPGSKSSTTFLSLSLLRELKLTDQQQHVLARMNDNGVSFAFIADWIEANL